MSDKETAESIVGCYDLGILIEESLICDIAAALAAERGAIEQIVRDKIQINASGLYDSWAEGRNSICHSILVEILKRGS